MQTTANLWDVLCRDLETQRTQLAAEQHHLAASKFRETAEQVFRPASPRLCDAIEIAGDVCQASGALDGALTNFQDALKRNLAHGYIGAAARVAAKLALLQDYRDDYAAARTYFVQALELYSASHDASQRCMLLNHLASLEKRSGDVPSAIRHFQEALDSAVQMHGEVHPETALLCNNLGVAWTEAGDWVQAENSHMRALGIREKLFGAMHPDVAESLGNLAVVYHASGRWDKAEAFYQAALKTHAAFRKPGCPEMETVQANYEKLQKDRRG
ncbi:MAG: tetratricopeptide repeat protein [Terrimicrobiaceae bacterium]|nr:tetratricopeptide repeat protein [Terrimicrobiaceae bacterium]